MVCTAGLVRLVFASTCLLLAHGNESRAECEAGRKATANVHIVIVSNSIVPAAHTRARAFRDAAVCTWGRCVADLFLVVRKPVGNNVPRLMSVPGEITDVMTHCGAKSDRAAGRLRVVRVPVAWTVDVLFSMLSPMLKHPWVFFASEESFVSPCALGELVAQASSKFSSPIRGRVVDATEAPYFTNKLPAPLLDSGFLISSRAIKQVALINRWNQSSAFVPGTRITKYQAQKLTHALRTQLTRNTFGSVMASALLLLRGPSSVPQGIDGVTLWGDGMKDKGGLTSISTCESEASGSKCATKTASIGPLMSPREIVREADCSGLAITPSASASLEARFDAHLQEKEVMYNVMAHESEPKWIRELAETWTATHRNDLYFEVSESHYSELVANLEMTSHPPDKSTCCEFKTHTGFRALQTSNIASDFARWASAYEGSSAAAWTESEVRIVSLDLEAPPKDHQNFGKAGTTVKSWEWDRWLRKKMMAMVKHSIIEMRPEQDYKWIVFVDSDSWVDTTKATEMLSYYDSDAPVSIGRVHRFQRNSRTLVQIFLGGGAGIFVSRGALKAIRATWALCERMMNTTNWESFEHRGGDAWFGFCLQKADVPMIDDTWLQGNPPSTIPLALRRAAVSFHRGGSLHDLKNDITSSLTAVQTQADDLPCDPYYCQVDRKWRCATHFSIIGAPKTGTTSLFHYFDKHSKIALASEKELFFWGWPFMPDRQIMKAKVESDYLSMFPRITTGVLPPHRATLMTGEASPMYLYCPYAAVNIYKFMPRMRLIVLLREPAARALSEFENKKADQKLYRYTKQRYGSTPYKGLDNSSKHDVPTWYQLVSASASTFQRCTPATLFTFYDSPEFMRQYRHCYVNPFVLGSAYSRYLRPWVDLFGDKKQLLILDQAELLADPIGVTQRAAIHAGMPHKFATVEAEFSGIEGQVYNTKFNRGVHSASGTDKVGGTANATSVDQMLTNEGEEQKSVADQGVACILASFYSPYSRDLLKILDRLGFPRMAWAEKASKEPVNPCPCLQMVSKSAHRLQPNFFELQTLRAFQSAARCGGTKAAKHKPGEHSNSTSMEEVEGGHEDQEPAPPVGEANPQLAPSDEGEPESASGALG